MKVLPLIYMGNHPDDELAKHACSDRIWVGKHTFETYTRDSEPGITICLKLRNAVDQTVPVSIYGVHHDDEGTIYVPQWMLEELEHDHDHVQIELCDDISMCSSISIAPHTSDHLASDDPQTLLRDGFENYTFLMPGRDYEIWLGSHSFIVSLVSVQPDQPVVCIRDCELTVELLPPLDLPIPPPPAAAVESPPSKIEEAPTNKVVNTKEIIADQIASGLRPSNEVLRAQMRDAALKRLAAAAAEKQ